MEDAEDLERSLLASEVLSLSAARARRASELVALARETAAEGDYAYLTEAADSMARAAMALSVADAGTRPRAAAELVRCAAKLSWAAREAKANQLADDAFYLAEASEELTRMAADLKATMEFGRLQNPGLLGRIAAFCTSRARSSTQGDISAMQPLGLGLSLSLFPYMGRQGILSTENFSNNDLWWINVVFSSWWCLVSLVLAASLCPENRLQVEFVRLSRHLSMLGITILVIIYGCVMLAPHAWITVLFLLAVSCIFHTVFYLQSWRRGM
ncbi:unnamed protein product [Alopecurus aequalis]